MAGTDPDRDQAIPKGFNVEANLPQLRLRSLERGHLLRGEVHNERIEHRLPVHHLPSKLAQDLFVHDALVGGVLVDHVHAVRSLGNDVGPADLP